MLPIVVPPVDELWDEKRNCFLTFGGCMLQLENSLISISKWECIWMKAFLKNINKLTVDEFRSYIKCMTLNKGVDSLAYICLTSDNLNQIKDYINRPMTAIDPSILNSQAPGGSSDTVTSEVIYYKMIVNSIPFECARWHINRLLALIRVCDMKNAPDKRVGSNAIINKYARLNEQNKQKFHTKG